MEKKLLEFLIVDDSPTTHKYLKKMILNNFECEVYEAIDAWSSLRLIGNHNIDLILMDINMPDIDGFQTVNMIRKNKQARRIPVIYITGTDPENLDMQKGLEIGGLDFLHKPFKENDLVRMLRLYIRFIEREKELNSELLEMNAKLHEEIRTRLNAQKELAANDEQSKGNSSISKLDIDSILAFSRNFDDIRKDLNSLVSNYYDLSDDENFLMLKSLRTTINEARQKLNSALNI